jgi:RNA polymerase sigma factor (sigma-70 family)
MAMQSPPVGIGTFRAYECPSWTGAANCPDRREQDLLAKVLQRQHFETGTAVNMETQGDNPSDRTRHTLLRRVRDVSDQAAWSEFVADYGPRILRWCTRHGLQESDCADVVQDVLTRLVAAMRSFQYDPQKGRFRGWLKTVTTNAIHDFVKHHQRPGAGSGDSAVGRLLNAVEDPETVKDLSHALERQAEIEMFREAESRVRVRVKPTNWEAWFLGVREQMKAGDVAQKLGIQITDVYVARSRINTMISDEVRKLESLDLSHEQE